MFKRLMEKVLQPVPVSVCMMYLDDILVHVSTYAAVITNLHTAFELITKNSFLGYVISKRGVSTDPEKVEAVEKFPSPMSKGEVRSFLGLASYYQRSIAGFANITWPLHQLTEKGQWFTWSPVSQAN
ncbi:hypothetical protein AAFF_G00066120 [Aldrovandia affinis]|uniref:Reverse transcriptase domain-containing protein n=1 Tax=Aldrovandia affinis TaxID=143900 RepID=A0AAD7WZM8_9TELE|nr:hypothetical protein AAFF_G00066120 [Aldrovandia affinis]